jgi:hypothetical protein
MCLVSRLLHSLPQLAQVIISEGDLMALYCGIEYVSTLMNSTQLTVKITFYEEYLHNLKR